MTFTVGLMCDNNCGKIFAKEFRSMEELEQAVTLDDAVSWIIHNGKHFCGKKCKAEFKVKEIKTNENKV